MTFLTALLMLFVTVIGLLSCLMCIWLVLEGIESIIRFIIRRQVLEEKRTFPALWGVCYLAMLLIICLSSGTNVMIDDLATVTSDGFSSWIAYIVIPLIGSGFISFLALRARQHMS